MAYSTWNRRRFLAAGLASLGACAAPAPRPTPPPALSGAPVAAARDLRRLVVERADPLLGRCRYVAHSGAGRLEQPILVVRRGELIDAVIENALPQPTTVHFHGLTLPEAQDGAGFDPIVPGGRKRARFEVKNRAGLYWFHPHAHGFTAEQVYAGLAGLLVVTDEDDDALDAALGLAPGNRLVLAIADVRVEGGLLRPYAPSAQDCLNGWFGNRALVNGRLDASFAVGAGWVRLQILNTCNARGLLLAFREGDAPVAFHLLGTDGGLLAAPKELERVFLHTGERIDIALDVRGRRTLAAVSLEFDPRHHHPRDAALPHRHSARQVYPPLADESLCTNSSAVQGLADGAELPLFGLRIDGPARAAPALPTQLSSLAEPAAVPQTPVRRMRLDFDERAGFLIDQKPYAADEVAFSLPRGMREVWEIKNSPISMPHAMHLHGFGFRVLRRQGTFGPARRLATEPGGRLATDLGIKDTVVLWPNETLWLAVDFALPAEAAFQGAQRYMFHCHNLEHEDGMMMRNFSVL